MAWVLLLGQGHSGDAVPEAAGPLFGQDRLLKPGQLLGRGVDPVCQLSQLVPVLYLERLGEVPRRDPAHG